MYPCQPIEELDLSRSLAYIILTIIVLILLSVSTLLYFDRHSKRRYKIFKEATSEVIVLHCTKLISMYHICICTYIKSNSLNLYLVIWILSYF